MNGNDIRKSFEKNYKKYFIEALKVKVHFKRKDIHEMRMTLKKTRAYIEFMNTLTQGKTKPWLPADKINSIFTNAGRLRDEQVNLQLLDDKKVSKAAVKFYEKAVAGLIKKSKQALKSELKPGYIELKKPEHKALKKLLSDFTSSQIEQSAIIYLNKKWKEIDKLLLSKNTTQAMHQVRIRLKHIEAISDLLKGNKKFSLPERLGGITQEIGEWHDLAVFADSIKEVCGAKTKKSEPKKELLQLRNTLEKRNKSYARDILFSIRQLRRTKPVRKN